MRHTNSIVYAVYFSSDFIICFMILFLLLPKCFLKGRNQPLFVFSKVYSATLCKIDQKEQDLWQENYYRFVDFPTLGSGQ